MINLIKQSKLELEKRNQSTQNVGNRPHFPMLVMYNNNIDEANFEAITLKLGRIWPQSLRHIINIKYALPQDGGSTVFSALENGTQKTTEELQQMMDDSKREKEAFESRQSWCVYNIVETSEFKSIDEFKKYYSFYSEIGNIVLDSYKTMLIVLLDDSTAKRSVANDIRKFISENSEYDSTIILSTRTRGNDTVDIKDLYQIVANLLIISNNDSILSSDDEDYKARMAKIYSKTPYLVSYMLKERPNKKITLQLYDSILKHLNKKIAENNRLEFGTWVDRLGFSSGMSTICEDFLKTIDLQALGMKAEAFEHLPIKEGGVTENIDFSAMNYKQIKPYLFEDVFTSFVENYCKTELTNYVVFDGCVEMFREHVHKEFSALELIGLTDETIDRIFDQLDCGKPNYSLRIKNYFENAVKIYIREHFIYEQFKIALKTIRNRAKNIVATINDINNRFQRYNLIDASDVGTMYPELVTRFFDTTIGVECVKDILNANNKEEDILKKMLVCFKRVIDKNAETFSLNFTEEWAMRLGVAGDEIYRRISEALNKDTDDAICLYGNYPIIKSLVVFMLHTTDAGGNNPTELYQYIKNTFEHDASVQYLNTGYDDALEAITLVECSGINLL